MVRLVSIFSPMLWDATLVYPHSAVLLSCPGDTVVLCSVLPCTLHPRLCSQITDSCTSPSPLCHRSLIIDYCTSPLPCLSLGFSAVFALFPRPAEITFFFCNPLPIRVGASCYRRPPYVKSCLPQCSCLQPKTQKKKLLHLHNIFFDPQGGECTVDRAHLRPQSTERIPARVQNANIHAHRQTLLRYRPRERVFESDFLSVFRHK